jgi:DNA-binding phage protein
MGAKVSAEMRLALQYVKDGKRVYQAAALAGVTPSALYKALKEQQEKKSK